MRYWLCCCRRVDSRPQEERRDSVPTEATHIRALLCPLLGVSILGGPHLWQVRAMENNSISKQTVYPESGWHNCVSGTRVWVTDISPVTDLLSFCSLRRSRQSVQSADALLGVTEKWAVPKWEIFPIGFR